MTDPIHLSVCIPARNAAAYIREAIGSVLSQLPPASEVVVVDDGSTDDTAAVAESFGAPVTVIRSGHGGIGAAFNGSVAAARGRLIASIDADDRWLPGKLASQLAVLETDPSVDAVFTHYREFLSPDIPEAMRNRWICHDGPAPGMCRGTMLLRREAWERVGPMQTDLRVGEFIAWYSRATEQGLKIQVLPEVMLERRIHGNNTVLRERDSRSDYLRILKAKLDRRRAAAEET